MFAYIKGILTVKEPMLAVVEAGGLGYELRVSLNTSARLQEGKPCMLHTYMQVKEDGHTLFGFAEIAEKKVFLSLTAISGIGPGTALTILSYMSVEEFYEAVRLQKTNIIQAVKGIGKKTAERVVLELKDKVPQMSADISSSPGDPVVVAASAIKEEALAALTMLGVPKPLAEKNIENVLRHSQGPVSLEDLIKLALKNK